MPNNTFYQKISSISPHIEMVNRRLYYLLKPLVDKFIKPNKRQVSKVDNGYIDFKLIIEELKNRGLKPGDVLVLHSSYSELKVCNLSPIEIVNMLLDYLGPTGTLAVPAFAIYSEPSIGQDGKIMDVFDYDVSSTNIWTGVLSKAVLNDPRSIRSLHPLNSMVAIGDKAKKMMEKNETELYPCGLGSSWNFCHLQNAFILGLGTDLTHSLTMIHVAEDTKVDDWCVADWYHDRKFRVKDGEKEFYLNVKERRYVWGKLHFAERNLAKDLIQMKIMKTGNLGTILIETLRSTDLIEFLESKNKTGYPYFWVKSK